MVVDRRAIVVGDAGTGVVDRVHLNRGPLKKEPNNLLVLRAPPRNAPRLWLGAQQVFTDLDCPEVSHSRGAFVQVSREPPTLDHDVAAHLLCCRRRVRAERNTAYPLLNFRVVLEHGGRPALPDHQQRGQHVCVFALRIGELHPGGGGHGCGDTPTLFEVGVG